MHEQMPSFGRQGLNQKSAPIFSAQCTFTNILKFSCKIIENVEEGVIWAKPNFEISQTEIFAILSIFGCFSDFLFIIYHLLG